MQLTYWVRMRLERGEMLLKGWNAVDLLSKNELGEIWNAVNLRVEMLLTYWVRMNLERGEMLLKGWNAVDLLGKN